MKLSQLASKPQLVKLEIDDQETVEEYGEPLEFYIYDRQSIDTYMKLASLDEKNQSEIVNLINGMVYDESGELILADDNTLPINLLGKLITKVVSNLGNVTSQTIEQ